jgi:hypothetical protein
MIEYTLVLNDDSEYSLNGAAVTYPLSGSLSLGDNGSSFENVIIEKSYGPGSVKLGESRLAAQKITMKLSSVFEEDSDYDVFLNSLLSALSKAVYLVDETNAKRTMVAASECSESYDKGCYKRSVDFLISFTQLTPYWEALTDTAVNLTTIPSVPFVQAIVNAGSLPAPSTITMTAVAPCAGISFSLIGENKGIYIEDSQFGTAGYLTMVLDNAIGELSIGTLDGSATLEEGSLDRRLSILDGTGFFDFRDGVSQLSILSTVAVSVQIRFKRRDYR